MRRFMPSIRRVLPLWIGVCGLAQAQPRYSLNEILDLAMRGNRELAALRQRLPEAEGEKLQAGLRPNPALDLNFANGSVLGNRGYWDGAVGITQAIETGGKRMRRVDVAGATLEAARFEIRERERVLRGALHEAYIEALAAERNLEIHRELSGLMDRSFEVVKARVAQGEAPRLDQQLLGVEVGRLRADLAIFEGQKERALARLRGLVGMASEEAIGVSGKLELPSAGLELNEARRVAVAERPDVQFLRKVELGSAASVALEKSQAIPNINVSAKYGYTYDFIQRVQVTPLSSIPVIDRCAYLSLGVSMELPWRNRNQGNIAAAVARKNAARLQREHQENVAANEVSAAWKRMAAARKAAEAFERDVLVQAMENLRIVRSVYEQGEIRLLEVLNEQRRLVDSQRTYTDLLKESQLAWAEMRKTAGQDLEGGAK